MPMNAVLFVLIAAVEPLASLQAKDLLPPALLAGPRYSVQAAVASDGYMTAFVLKSDFGLFEAPSRELLELRVAEIAALARLEDVSKTDVFAKSLGAAAEKKAKSLVNVATHPVETAKAAPASVGRFFKGIGNKGKKAADDAKDVALGDDQAAGGPPGPGVKEEAEGAAKDVLGMSKARRQWAQQLGVDPYTTNPVLASKLDDVGWAAYAGGFAMKLAPIGTVASVASSVNDLVWQATPEDVAKRNDAALTKMGIGEPARKAFLKNRFFTPTLQTEMVVALEALGAAKGREEALALATRESDSESDARFFRRNAQLLALHAKTEPIASLHARRRVFVGRTAAGAIVLPAAFDYLTWTADVEAASGDATLKAPRRTLLLSGRASETVKKELAARGWTLKESAPAR